MEIKEIIKFYNFISFFLKINSTNQLNRKKKQFKYKSAKQENGHKNFTWSVPLKCVEMKVPDSFPSPSYIPK